MAWPILRDYTISSTGIKFNTQVTWLQIYLSEWLLFNAKWAIFQLLLRREQVIFCWDDDDDDVYFFPSITGGVGFFSASSMKEQSIDRHVTLICKQEKRPPNLPLAVAFWNYIQI